MSFSQHFLLLFSLKIPIPKKNREIMSRNTFPLSSKKPRDSRHLLRHISSSLILGLLFGTIAPSHAQTFPTLSVDPSSPAIDGALTPDDVLVEGPAVFIQGSELGLNDKFDTGEFDKLNALSYGLDPIQNPLYFSVNRVAVGLPGSAVDGESVGEDAAGDVYQTLPPFGSNSLVIDEEELGLEKGFFGDNLNGLDLDTLPEPDFVFFSVDDRSNPNSPFQDKILVSKRDDQTGKYQPFIPYADGPTHMGINELDDLDALILWDVGRRGYLDPGEDMALFSLRTISSPSTFTFPGPDKPYIPGKKGNLSPADILWTDFTGDFELWAPAEEIGLFPDDELDALDTIIPVPEPSAVLGIFVLGGLGLIGRKKKQ